MTGDKIRSTFAKLRVVARCFRRDVHSMGTVHQRAGSFITALSLTCSISAVAAIESADCLACHSDKSLTQSNAAGRNISLFVDAAAFKTSVHGSLTCADCHDDLTAGHPDDIRALAVSCAACHETAADDITASVHKSVIACADCHSAHDTKPATKNAHDAASVETCSRCHASERINTRYNLPGDRVETFFDSYHGLASKYGSTVAANCASCHGYHKILPSSDARSTIHKNNLVATCGKCHPGASEKFAEGKIHASMDTNGGTTDTAETLNRWVRIVYLWLIGIVVGGMASHNGLLFLKKVRARLRSANRPVLRMNRSQRWQHGILAVSFVVLAITGFALKFPDSWLAAVLGSSEPIRSLSHRIAGVVLLLIGVYHLGYVAFNREGRRLAFDFLPVKKDLADVLGTIRWLVGLRKEKPAIGRFGYAEKMEYWAVIWGTIIMGVTGLMVWFKMEVTQWLPRWAVDVALTIHYFEAILACLAIIVWHFYHVLFDPDVYPMNLACWDGKVSGHWQKEEHPLEVIEAENKTPAKPANPSHEQP